MTDAAGIVPHKWSDEPTFVIDRRPWSLERLCQRLIARLLSARRKPTERMAAGLLLAIVGSLVVLGKIVGYLLDRLMLLWLPGVVALAGGVWMISRDPVLARQVAELVDDLGRLLQSVAGAAK